MFDYIVIRNIIRKSFLSSDKTWKIQIRICCTFQRSFINGFRLFTEIICSPLDARGEVTSYAIDLPIYFQVYVNWCYGFIYCDKCTYYTFYFSWKQGRSGFGDWIFNNWSSYAGNSGRLNDAKLKLVLVILNIHVPVSQYNDKRTG